MTLTNRPRGSSTLTFLIFSVSLMRGDGSAPRKCLKRYTACAKKAVYSCSHDHNFHAILKWPGSFESLAIYEKPFERLRWYYNFPLRYGVLIRKCENMRNPVFFGIFWALRNGEIQKWQKMLFSCLFSLKLSKSFEKSEKTAPRHQPFLIRNAIYRKKIKIFAQFLKF